MPSGAGKGDEVQSREAALPARHISKQLQEAAHALRRKPKDGHREKLSGSRPICFAYEAAMRRLGFSSIRWFLHHLHTFGGQ